MINIMLFSSLVEFYLDKIELIFLYSGDLQNENNMAHLVIETQSTITFKTFWDSLMFYQIFLSPEVKQGAIITYKHGTYELPNDLRFRILAN